MKTISIKSPNLEYYLAAEKCDKALNEFFEAYVFLQHTRAPFYVETVEDSRIDEHIVACYEAWLGVENK